MLIEEGIPLHVVGIQLPAQFIGPSLMCLSQCECIMRLAPVCPREDDAGDGRTAEPDDGRELEQRHPVHDYTRALPSLTPW